MSEMIVIANHSDSQLPVWARTTLVDPETGVIYAPAVMINEDEDATFWSACWSDTPYIWHADHLYLPLDVLSAQDPNLRETCTNIERSVKAFLAAEETAS